MKGQLNSRIDRVNPKQKRIVFVKRKATTAKPIMLQV